MNDYQQSVMGIRLERREARVSCCERSFRFTITIVLVILRSGDEVKFTDRAAVLGAVSCK